MSMATHSNVLGKLHSLIFPEAIPAPAEETVVAIARFMARLANAATLRDDKDTGILYQELLAGKGPDHMKAGASSLREAVRIKVQDNKVRKHRLMDSASPENELD
jgi:hypothetical protein